MTGTDLVRRFFDAANARDWATIEAIHTADAVYHDPHTPPAEPGGAGMASSLAFYATALHGRWEVHDIVDAGGYVATRWTGHGLHDNDMIGIPASGKELHVDAFSLMRGAGGLIAEHWCAWDTAGMLRQVGVLPDPAA